MRNSRARHRTLRQARCDLDAGRVRATDLLEDALAAIEAQEGDVRALTTPTFDLARNQAASADERLAAGERTPLLGIPVVVKDLFDVAGIPTTAGSRVLADNIPVTSSTVWQRMETAGAVLVGKANTHEFAYGGTTAPTRNPADTSRIVGGSSGGPAAALAAGYCLGAIGTDTAGSVRIPANLCGIPALKPTRGMVPTDGVIPLSETLDVVGPMGRSVADLGLLWQVLADHTEPVPVEHKIRFAGLLRPSGPHAPSVTRAQDAAVAALRQVGVQVTEVELRGFAQSVLDDFTIMGYEASRIHQRWVHRRDLYTPYVRTRLDEGAEVSTSDYWAARARADQLAAELDEVLARVDVLLLPGVPYPAPPAYDERVLVDGEWEDRDLGLCRNTAFANLTGHPVLGVPAGMDEGLPVGVQLVGPREGDLGLVTLGTQLERLLPPGLPPRLRPELRPRGLA